MKRFLALALVLLTAIGCFSGCGGKDSSSDSVVLKWYVPCEKQKDEAKVEKRVNELLKDKLDATLDVVYIDPTAYTQKMGMIVSSGEEFDLCFTASWSLNYTETAIKGGFRELTDLLDEYGKDIKELIPESVLESATINGELYAIPNYQTNVIQDVVATYKSLADKYGFDMSTVKDIRDIEPFLEVIKQNEPTLIPFRTNSGPLTVVREKYELLSNGLIGIDKTNDKYEAVLVEDKRKECAELYMDWYSKGYIRQDVNTVMNDVSDASAGRYAFFTRGDAKPGFESEMKNSYGGEVVSAVIGKPYVNYNAGQSAMTAISSTSKHPELAMQLINIVNSDKEIYNTLCYGLEGEHYKKLEGDIIEYLDGSSNYKPFRDWAFGCQFNAYVLSENDPDVWEKTVEYNESAQPSKLSGFYFDKTPVLAEISNVNTIQNEYSALFNGSVKKSEFDDLYKEYDSKLESAGLMKIKKELQKQIDEWVKNK